MYIYYFYNKEKFKKNIYIYVNIFYNIIIEFKNNIIINKKYINI